jgi:hypothetical protein
MFANIALGVSTHSSFSTHCRESEENSFEEQSNLHWNLSASRANVTDLSDSVTRATEIFNILNTFSTQTLTRSGRASLRTRVNILSNNCGHSLAVGSINFFQPAINKVLVTCLLGEGKQFLPVCIYR